MAVDEKINTPLLDELEKGPWPSFVREIKRARETSSMCDDLLGQLELSYEERIGHWKHGGIVGVLGYGGGVIGRYSDLPDKFPKVAHFHTLRINMPSGWFYTSDALRKLCGIWERHGSGLTNMHGSTGDIVFLGTRTEELEPTFKELTEAGFDLGGSGSCVRTPSACVGPARCEWACYDTLKLCNDITHEYQDELHRPAFPYKFKFKFAGCPNDCVAAIARADMSIIGTWKDDIRQDDAAVAEYAAGGLDIQKDVVEQCPTKCISWDGQKLRADPVCSRRRTGRDDQGADFPDLGFLGRVRQEPGADRRTHSAHGHGHVPGCHWAGPGAGDDLGPARQPVHLLPGGRRRGMREGSRLRRL